jgi:hypothetical protein
MALKLGGKEVGAGPGVRPSPPEHFGIQTW